MTTSGSTHGVAVAKRWSAAVTMLLCTFAVVIASIAAVLARLNAVNASATTLDPVLGTISGVGVIGTLLILTGIVCLAMVALRIFFIVVRR